MVAGKIINFEPLIPDDGKGLQVSSDFCIKELEFKDVALLSNAEELQETGKRTLEALERMKVGARVIMKKYPVKGVGIVQRFNWVQKDRN